MCGLVGIAGDTCVRTEKVFRDLLLFDQVRGWDSTGVGRVGNHAKTMVVEKEVGPPNVLWNTSKEWSHKGIPVSFNKVYMGHNRAATIGKVEKDNAHPFTFGHITGAHNGTLREYTDLKGHKEYDVDSMSLFKHIEEEGLEHTWSNFVGAAAITYWDDKEETLTLIRNTERPLYLTWVKAGRCIVWASEEWMIEAALEHNGMAPTVQKDMDDIILLKPHHAHIFKPKNTSCVLEEVKELTPKKVVGFRKNNVISLGGKKSMGLGDGDPRKFNFRWTKGKSKAGKEMVGRKFRLRQASNFSSRPGYPDENKYVVSGNFIDGKKERIVIYPDTFESWDILSGSIFEDKFDDNVYRLIRRPRCINPVAANADPYVYCASDSIIELVSGIDPFKMATVIGKPKKTEDKVGPHNGKWLLWDNTLTTSRITAESNLNLAGNRCGLCDKDLTVEDTYEYTYNGIACLCEECMKNKDDFRWLNESPLKMGRVQ